MALTKIPSNLITLDAIDGTLIADDAIDSEHIANGAIDAAHMSVNSIDSDSYVDGSIDTAHIGDDQVTAAKLANAINTSIAAKLPLAGGTMTGDINFGDSDKAVFGAGSDLQIYHDSSNSYIKDQGTGQLVIDGNAVILQYSSASKLTTTSTGIDVTGTITVGYDSNSTHQILKTYATAHASGNRGGQLEFGLNDGAFTGIKVINSAAANSSYNKQEITFETHEGAVSVAERMRIDSLGNVGIGETSPDAKLHIMTASNGASTVGGASDELILENSTDCGLTIRSGSSSDGVISFADADDHNIGQIYYTHSTNDMTFRTNDSIAMVIDNAGIIKENDIPVRSRAIAMAMVFG